jgi:hypothetical protein
MPLDLLLLNKPLKHGDIWSRTRDDLMAMVWTGKHDVYILRNMHSRTGGEGNFCDEYGNALKPKNVQDNN